MLQGTTEWLQERCGRITASRMPELMATLKTGKPAQGYTNVVRDTALERLMGKPLTTFQSEWMRRGNLLEPAARRAYSDQECVHVEEQAIAIHPDYDWISASPDGLVGPDGLVELKCLTAANHFDALRNGTQANTYYWQVHGQMLCMPERQWVDVVAYHPDFPPGLQLAIKRIHRNEDDLQKLLETCLRANEEIESEIAKLREMADANESL